MASRRLYQKILKVGLLGAVATGMALSPAKAEKKANQPQRPNQRRASRRKEYADEVNASQTDTAMIAAKPETLPFSSGEGPTFSQVALATNMAAQVSAPQANSLDFSTPKFSSQTHQLDATSTLAQLSTPSVSASMAAQVSAPQVDSFDFSTPQFSSQTHQLDAASTLAQLSAPSVSEGEVSNIPSLDTVPHLFENEAPEAPEVTDVVTELPVAQAIPAGAVQILSPEVNTVLDVPAATVILQYPMGADLELRVNDQVVDRSLIGRTETNSATSQILENWYGVGLEVGENIITVTPRGETNPLASVIIQVAGQPTRLTVDTREARAPADGRSTARVEGQLLDDNGNPSNWDTVVTLTASDGQFIGADHAPDQPGFQVETTNGYFSAELQSPITAQRVQIKATALNMEAYNQVQFTTQQRPSLVTGMVDLRFGPGGTDFHDSFRDFLPLDEDNGYELDVDASVFALGNVGEWLFTGAFNSDRPLNEDCRGETSLFRASASCENAYSVYGDDSTSDVVAPSIDRFYARLERTSPVPDAGTDFIMWGDYNTEEFANSSQMFTATNRQLHGFKFNYNLGDLAVTGLFANNIEGFQRDTISPDGTSGLYFLSRRLVIPGSESIFLELEELDRPGTGVERTELFRGTDYDVDYDRGTILFRRPVLRTEVGEFGAVLVRRIVATYQFEGEDGSTNLFGGRLQYNLSRTLNQESWVGTSYIRENQGNRNFELFGADTQISFGDDLQLIAEYARSSNDFDLSGPVSGSAYRLELDGSAGDWLTGRAYFRSTDAGFSNNATTSFQAGQTRYGAQASVQVAENTSVRAQYDHEDNFGVAPRPITSLSELLDPGTSPTPGARVDNSLTTVSLGLAHQIDNTQLEFDWIHRDRTDRISPNALTATSDQIRTRLTTDIADDLTIYAQNELNISSESDPLYPNRTLFGADWQVMPGVSVGLSQVFYGDGGFNVRDSLTSFNVSGDYDLGEDTTVRGRFSLIEDQQIGGTIGLDHGITLGPGLRLDLSYEHVFSNTFGTTAAGTQFSQPFAVGDGASALGLTSGDSFSVGLNYTDNPDFQANAQFEYRTSSQGSNLNFRASALGRLSPAVTTLFNYEFLDSANQNLGDLPASHQVKLGLAYRDPNDDRFNALLRYEYRKNSTLIPDTLLFGTDTGNSEHLFSGEAIYAPNWRWELYGKYAFRHSTTRIGGSTSGDIQVDDFVSNGSVHLAQMRATYRLGYAWDLTGEARWIGGSGYSEVGFSAEAGYYITPSLRLSAGYNFGSANDRDFSGSNRSAGGVFFGVTAKLDSLFGDFGIQEVAPSQQQESEVEVIADEESEIETVAEPDEEDTPSMN